MILIKLLRFSLHKRLVFVLYKLIIIDDEPMILDLMSSALDWKQFDFELAGTFSNCDAALQFIETNSVDVIFSDIKMPGKDGLELARICHERYPDIKIILISAFSDFEYARSAIKYNVSEYITKPFTGDMLKNVLRKISDELKAHSVKENSFLKLSLQMKFCKLFDDVLCGEQTSLNLFEEFIKGNNICTEQKDGVCAIISICIEDFAQYLSKIWKYGIQHFYSAVGVLISFDAENYYSGVIKNKNDIIEILLIMKDGTADTSNVTDGFIASICSELHDNLNLSVKADISQKFSSVYDLFGAWKDNTENHPEMLNQAIEYMEKNFNKFIKIKEISSQIHLSEAYFQAFFKKQMGVSVINYLTQIRMKMAEVYLLDPEIKMSNLHYMVGYKNKSHFYNVFKKSHGGLTPFEYRKMNKGAFPQ